MRCQLAFIILVSMTKRGIHRIPASRFYQVFAGEEPAPELSGEADLFC
jgi:hypothetical protein